MKLFHVTTIPATLGFLRHQVGFMRSHGFHVHAVSSRGSELQAFGRSQGVPVHPVTMQRSISPWSDLIGLVELMRLFRRHRPDIVHAHTPKAGLLGMLAARLTNVPCRIFHLHGLPHSTAAPFSRLALIASTRAAAFCSTRVLSVSRSVAEQCTAEKLCGNRSVTVPANGSINGVDANELFHPLRFTPEQAKSNFGLAPGALVAGFAGRLVKDKGVAELSRAWCEIRSQFPNAYLLIAGQPETRDGAPASILQILQSDPRVRILGWCGDMRSFYAAVDVLVLPTYREGLPSVILEAAAMGVPAVASRCVGCVDAVVDGVTGTLVPPGDSAALAAAIGNYWNHPVLQRQHGLKARERILRDFRPEDVWNATLKEYEIATRFTRQRPGSRITRAGKRSMDIATSFVMLALLSPLLALLALAVWLSMGSPVLFRHKRPGLRELPFTMLKFRTMQDDCDSAGRSLPDGKRLTPLGRFLRRNSLDELPELWNVLIGDMSLVGPRPLLFEYVDHLGEDERRRALVRPGITGWAQVHGRNLCAWDERLARDIWYLDHFCLGLDLRILARTLRQVASAKGVIEDPRSVMLNLDEERRLRGGKA